LGPDWQVVVVAEKGVRRIRGEQLELHLCRLPGLAGLQNPPFHRAQDLGLVEWRASFGR